MYLNSKKKGLIGLNGGPSLPGCEGCDGFCTMVCSQSCTYYCKAVSK